MADPLAEFDKIMLQLLLLYKKYTSIRILLKFEAPDANPGTNIYDCFDGEILSKPGD